MTSASPEVPFSYEPVNEVWNSILDALETDATYSVLELAKSLQYLGGALGEQKRNLNGDCVFELGTLMVKLFSQQNADAAPVLNEGDRREVEFYRNAVAWILKSAPKVRTGERAPPWAEKMTRARMYAEGTEVPVDRSKSQIESMLRQAGADDIATMSSFDRAIIAFKLGGRVYRFVLPLPDRKKSAQQYDRHLRQRWRALLLVLKAKLEAGRSGITTLEIELLPYAVLPGGGTVHETIIPRLAQNARDGTDLPLLPGPGA